MTQMIDTDPEYYPQVMHPDGSGMTGVDVMLRYINVNPEAREAAGWNLPSHISGETEDITRWQRLVRACNGPNATDQARSLGLTE
jgi:hypothetical protein